MVRKVITDALLKGTKAPSAGRVELSDMRCPGLEFRVTPAGSRSFSFRFRDPNSGAVTRSTIGPYPEISLSDARTAADILRGKVAKGINPVPKSGVTERIPAIRRFARCRIGTLRNTRNASSDPLVPTSEICAGISYKVGQASV